MDTLTRVATHEAGHAVTALVCGFDLLCVIARTAANGGGGCALYRASQDKERERIIVSVAGTAAEARADEVWHFRHRIFGFIHAMSMEDKRDIRELALKLRPDDIDGLVCECYDAAADILERHWPAVERMRDALIDRIGITGDEAKRLLTEPLPRTYRRDVADGRMKVRYVAVPRPATSTTATSPTA